MKQYFIQKCLKLRKIDNGLSFIRLDFSFVLLFVLALFLEEVWLYFYFVFFVSLHEMCHFFVAKKLGYLPEKIRFNFFGASLEGYDDFLPRDEIKIVLAGPLFNFCVVILCYLSFWFWPESFNFLNDILIANLSIFLFNMMPIFPLDAGRLLLAFFTCSRTRKDALLTVKKCSYIFLGLLFLVFLISFFFEYNFTLGFVCVNLASLMFSSSKDTSFKRQLFAKKKFKNLSRGMIERNIYVSEKTKDYSLFKFIDDYHFVNFIFLDKSGKEVKRLSEVEFYQRQGLL